MVESGRCPAGFSGSMIAPSVRLARRGLDRSPLNGAAFPIVEEVSSAESTDFDPTVTTFHEGGKDQRFKSSISKISQKGCIVKNFPIQPAMKRILHRFNNLETKLQHAIVTLALKFTIGWSFAIQRKALI